MWSDSVMLLLEFLAAICAVAICGGGILACARRLLLGGEALRGAGGAALRQAEVLGCDEPSCPYYKKNAKFLLVPASRRRVYTSPTRTVN